MMGSLTEETVHGYENFQNKIKELTASKPKTPIVILFTGSSDASGHSWCPDCVELEKLLEKFRKEPTTTGYLLTVTVGDRSAWKDKECPFRTDKDLRLTSVPTMMTWKTPKKLFGADVENIENIKMLFEED